MTGKKKKILRIVLASVLGAAILVGIGLAIRHSVRGSRVIVISAMEQAEYEGDPGEMTSIEGVISSGASQSIYLTESMPVKEVKVQEGQEVKKGDVLLVYDTTKAKFNAEKEELGVKQVENSIQIAERNIRTLRNMKPSSGEAAEDDTGDDVIDDTPEETTPEKKKETPKKDDKKEEKKDDKKEDPYKDVTAVKVLNGESKHYNNDASEKNLGSEANPYRFLCTADAEIEGTFMKAMKEKAAGKTMYFVIEVREGDKKTGALRMMWMHDAKQLPDVADDWKGTLQFAPKTDDPSGEGSSDPDPGTEGTAAGGFNPRVILLATDSDEEADDAGSGYGGSDGLISSSESYTASELKRALIEENEKLENLRLDLREAQLKLKKAKGVLAGGEAKATTDGVVKKIGDPQHPPTDGSAFLQVGATKGMTVRGGISERQLGRIQPGDIVRVTSWQTEEELTAVVDDVSPYPDTSGMFSSNDSAATIYPFTANIEESETSLSEDEWVQVYLTGASEDSEEEETLYVMKAFIRDDEDGKYVLKRGKGGKLVKQYIEVGKSSAGSYEVVDGITADDWLAFPYGKNATEGAKTREGTMDDLYEM